MNTEDLPPLTVRALIVDAFKRIEIAEVTPTPTGLVPVRGKNGQGKSSLIESMSSAFGGARSAPELPITEGHHASHVLVDLGAIRVEEHFKRDSGGKAKRSLVVVDAEGGKFSKPQQIMDELTGHFADPVAFESMKPGDQVATVLAILGLDAQLEALRRRESAAVDRRRDAKRDADRAEKALSVIREEVRALPEPPEQSVDDVLAELRAANETNAGIEKQVRLVESYRSEGARVAAACMENTKRIESLRAELASAEERDRALQSELEGLREKYRTANAALAAAPPVVDTAEVEARLQAARSVEAGQAKRSILVEKTNEVEALVAAAQETEAEVEAIREEIGRLFEGVEFPIPGMAYDYDANVLSIGGIPFPQASQAERLRASAAVAMAGDPKIRVLFVKEASLLDRDSLAILDEIAKERGFQVFAEIVDSDRGGVGIYIEDGRAYQEG